MTRPPRIVKRFNRVALVLAGRRFLPIWIVLTHRGRRSGREYRVPLAVIPAEGAFFLALPFGRDTDWVRNVVAAGRCRVRWKGADYECSGPEFVDRAVAVAAARGIRRFVLRRLPLQHGVLRLARSPV
jgi:deazaflavin-dependent oxidoreductase (nitroreductase family)